jgi:nucleotide-binding universal stress UspA family protein
MAIAPDRRPIPPPGDALDRVLCAVDGSQGSAEAVREAIAVAACAVRMDFIAVTGELTDEPNPTASLGRRRARHALEQAQGRAAEHGVRAGIELVEATDVAAALVAGAGARDLLVAGTHGTSRLAGAATGSIATALARRATGPLLVARAGGGRAATTPRILVAVDDSAAARTVAMIAGTIASVRGGYVHVVHVRGASYGAGTRRRLAEISLELISLTGAEPLVDVLRGAHVAAQIAEFAVRCDAALVVAGRRGPTRFRAAGSVGERLVHAAPCSVLVAPVAGTA